MLVHTRRGACTNKGCRCLRISVPVTCWTAPLCDYQSDFSLVLQPVVKYWCFSLLGFALAPVRFGIRSLFGEEYLASQCQLHLLKPQFSFPKVARINILL